MQVIYDTGNVWALQCFSSRRRRFRSVWKLIGKMRVWWNWQTRKIQVLITAMLCRFKSCHPHQTRIKTNPRENLEFVLFYIEGSFCIQFKRWTLKNSRAQIDARLFLHSKLSVFTKNARKNHFFKNLFTTSKYTKLFHSFISIDFQIFVYLN